MKIVAGLIELRKSGAFIALWVNDVTIRVQWTEFGGKQLMGWKQAAELVAAGRAAAAMAELPAKLPPQSERTASARQAHASNGVKK